jgi:hypothetical protein
MANSFNWTVRAVGAFGTMGAEVVIPTSFVRRAASGLYYRQWADSKGRPCRGAGLLFNPARFEIGQTPCREGLEALGLS